MFEAVQKIINDVLIVQKFAEINFRDLVILDNSYIIRKFIEASVQIETSDCQQTQALIKQKYANISKVCNTYFSKEENLNFIGISLLQTARKEKDQRNKEDLLKQAIEHFCAHPLNIDMT